MKRPCSSNGGITASTGSLRAKPRPDQIASTRLKRLLPQKKAVTTVNIAAVSLGTVGTEVESNAENINTETVPAPDIKCTKVESTVARSHAEVNTEEQLFVMSSKVPPTAAGAAEALSSSSAVLVAQSTPIRRGGAKKVEGEGLMTVNITPLNREDSKSNLPPIRYTCMHVQELLPQRGGWAYFRDGRIIGVLRYMTCTVCLFLRFLQCVHMGDVFCFMITPAI